jgi:hypothetical protein
VSFAPKWAKPATELGLRIALLQLRASGASKVFPEEFEALAKALHELEAMPDK